MQSTGSELSLAVIAGVFALLGVAVGHLLTMLSGWLDRKRQRKQLLLAKLDDLAAEDQTILRWLSQIREAASLLEMQRLHPSLPCQKIDALAVLYFPALTQAVSRYTVALRAYYTWAVAQVPKFSTDGSFQHPLLWCLHLSDKDAAERCSVEIEDRHRELAAAVAAEASRLLG